jgi:hypothetical protein
MTVFLIDKKRKIEMTLRETGGTVNWNLPMNTNDFRVFRDVQNTIEFVVRDTDRKPINMMGRSAEIIFYDHRIDRELWRKELRVINEARGICKLTIEPDIMADWFLQTYSYQVAVTNPDGAVHLLYVDANETQRGFFELLQGPRFLPRISETVTYEELLLSTQMPVDGRIAYRATSAIPGSLQVDDYTGVHTLAAYLDNFTGELIIEGSVEEGTPTEEEWFTIQTHEFDHETSTQGYSFEANLMWWRVKIFNQNDQNPYGEPPLEEDLGKVTKLVFRN